MRINILFIGSFIFLLGCKNNEVKKNNIQGYYYKEKEIEIFYITKSKLTIYNFIDSTSISLPLKIENQKDLIINKNRYSYKKKKDNSLLINSFGDDKEDVLLVKTDYNNFNITNLDKSEWKYISKDTNPENIKSFIRFEKEKGVSNFFKFEDEYSARESFFNNSIGKFFNKFYFYEGPSPFFLMKLDDNYLEILVSDNYQLHKALYKRVRKKKNSDLYGSWFRKENNDSKFTNLKTYHDLKSRIDKNAINYSLKIDSLNRLLNYNNIEFSKDGFFIRNIKTKSDSSKVKYNYDYSSNTNYIFVNHPYFKSQTIEIKKLTSDTLSIEISNPKLVFEFGRKQYVD